MYAVFLFSQQIVFLYMNQTSNVIMSGFIGTV